MLSNWLARVGSVIPRGFSRHYILGLLKEQPIYPMLGRLLEEGLIVETDGGRYTITPKGEDIASDIESVRHIIQKQLDVMLRVGNVGRFMALDLIDKISTIGSTLSSNLDKMTVQEKNRYREFLMKELNKIDKQQDNAEKLKVE